MATRRFATTWAWPTYSSRRPRAQRLVEAGVVVDGAAGDEAGIGHVRSALIAPRVCAARRRRRSSKRPSPSSRERAVDAPLGLGPRVAEVDERREEVVLGPRARLRRRRPRAPGSERRQLVLQLEHEALGRLLADAGDAGQAGHVARRAGRATRSGGLDAGEDVDARAWARSRRPRSAARRASCSPAVRKPKSASASSRTWVWMRRLTSAPALAQAVEGARAGW